MRPVRAGMAVGDRGPDSVGFVGREQSESHRVACRRQRAEHALLEVERRSPLGRDGDLLQPGGQEANGAIVAGALVHPVRR